MPKQFKDNQRPEGDWQKTGAMRSEDFLKLSRTEQQEITGIKDDRDFTTFMREVEDTGTAHERRGGPGFMVGTQELRKHMKDIGGRPVEKREYQRKYW
jgi:hypothetical protein